MDISDAWIRCQIAIANHNFSGKKHCLLVLRVMNITYTMGHCPIIMSDKQQETLILTLAENSSFE